MSPKVSVTLYLTKRTKRTFRFDAKEAVGQPPPPISNIYIDQSVFDYKAPEKIVLSVSAVDELEDQ